MRERVTASVCSTRHVAVTGRRGVRVVARRAPSGRSEVSWVYEYDEGIDPDDPVVRAAAETALARARESASVGAGLTGARLTRRRPDSRRPTPPC